LRPFGGELELENLDENIYFTDSGRSSIRLFLRSGENNKKHYLLPNFFCEVIEEIFIQENVKYTFYPINEHLEIDKEFISKQNYDVLYVINYFGKYTNLDNLNLEDKNIIEDNVFFDDFSNRYNFKNWYAFNSFRKISSIADGSLAKTNMLIENELIQNINTFSDMKYRAKDIKYKYLYNNEFSEKEYLELFNQAENLLDYQKDICKISDKSIYVLANQKIDMKKRKERFDLLLKEFNEFSILDNVDCYSFFPILIEKRDMVRTKLVEKNIFLPIHWPKSTQDNFLYQNILSIPLFENYDDKIFNKLIYALKAILK